MRHSRSSMHSYARRLVLPVEVLFIILDNILSEWEYAGYQRQLSNLSLVCQTFRVYINKERFASIVIHPHGGYIIEDRLGRICELFKWYEGRRTSPDSHRSLDDSDTTSSSMVEFAAFITSFKIYTIWITSLTELEVEYFCCVINNLFRPSSVWRRCASPPAQNMKFSLVAVTEYEFTEVRRVEWDDIDDGLKEALYRLCHESMVTSLDICSIAGLPSDLLWGSGLTSLDVGSSIVERRRLGSRTASPSPILLHSLVASPDPQHSREFLDGLFQLLNKGTASIQTLFSKLTHLDLTIRDEGFVLAGVVPLLASCQNLQSLTIHCPDPIDISTSFTYPSLPNLTSLTVTIGGQRFKLVECSPRSEWLRTVICLSDIQSKSTPKLRKDGLSIILDVIDDWFCVDRLDDVMYFVDALRKRAERESNNGNGFTIGLDDLSRSDKFGDFDSESTTRSKMSISVCFVLFKGMDTCIFRPCYKRRPLHAVKADEFRQLAATVNPVVSLRILEMNVAQYDSLRWKETSSW